ncbi:TlpA disulfide reductase family protein [Prolixibacteraceae bacterium]|nr:TlpA disulfide reductase family protein [Prolixibacteraceae bacterium]
MKTLLKFSSLMLIIFLASCTERTPRDYALLTMEVKDPKVDSLQVKVIGQPTKILTRNERGIFSDTVRFEKENEGLMVLFGNNDFTFLYLQKDKEVRVEVPNDDYTNLTFSQDLVKENELLNEALTSATTYREGLKEEVDVEKGTASAKEYLDIFKDKIAKTQADSLYKINANKVVKNYARVLITNPIKNRVRSYRMEEGDLAKGKPAPKFIDLENYKGGKTSLDDLKGKYVYIDIWATWCVFCKKEIPHLKKIEEKYHGKNIEFVSISYDAKSTYQKWRDMVKEKELGGIQLYANMDKSFTKAFAVRGYPTFILIDPQGKIVSADAPRPSNPELVKLLDSIL